VPEEKVLETVELTKHFGSVVAADAVSVAIRAGELVGVVGANGSGKTTFLNMVTGYLRPDRGRVLFMGKDRTGLPPRDMTRQGIARSFQIPQLYTSLSVLENTLLSLAAQAGQGAGLWHPLYGRSRVDEGREILGRFGLADYAHRPVGELPEGGRKLLDIALSFALRPKLLLMDEPTSGVSVEDKFQVMDTLMKVIEETRLTTIFVEHDMEVVQRYGRRVLAFNNGQVIHDGTPDAVLADREVRKAVLGVDTDRVAS
jgi:branched-chain amino acid transport system ATP-binding protein